MYKEANRLARTDALTGLLNRRGFEERANQYLAELHRHRIPCSIVLFDLDHFKQINDRFGHAAGDRILKAVACTLRPLLRTSDTLGRWGGEEFVIGLQHMNAAQALCFAERIRQAIASVSLVDTTGVTLPTVTASLGISSMNEADSSPDTALERADRALYQAKAGGRNQAISLEVERQITAD